ncbi:MAG: hypothetical protein P0Y66_06515 [Candidatus Kaistia colombiensis]|nr:MAG: hypothetical protein P0Y66_06515 [Kaistia sp.]
MDIARRLAALLCIIVSLALPGGSVPAMAAVDHAGQANCPHATLVSPAGKASHVAATSHAMTMLSSSMAPLHQPVGPAALPSCCIAMPTSAPWPDAAPALAAAVPGSLPRPRSDAMPVQRSIGPDLPPPRA